MFRGAGDVYSLTVASSLAGALACRPPQRPTLGQPEAEVCAASFERPAGVERMHVHVQCKQLAVRFHVAAGLSALQRLVLSDCLLMEQEPLAEIPDQLVSRTLGCELGGLWGAWQQQAPAL